MFDSKKLGSVTPLAIAMTSALLLAACSSGGSDPPPVNPGGGGNNNGGGGAPGGTPVTVSGKAADGYLAGATACLDVDSNMRCDGGEPSTTTGAGGAFTLTIPDGVSAASHPIVVEVVAGTIDEDTSFPVDKPYVLSAPAGESDFISPLTTAVHGILVSNPALTIDDAVAAVKASIGASDVSLFEDYVAAKQDASSTAADDYARLHRIAQVSAKALAENHEVIMEAAAAQGLDPALSHKALLMLIVEQVIGELGSSAQAVDTAGDDFDIDAVAVQTADATDLAEQLETAATLATAAPVSAQSLISQGLYWIWAEGDEVEYGRLKAAAQAGRLEETWFTYDGGVWVEGDDAEEDTPSFLGADGWTQISDTALNYAVTYQSDGSAILDLDGTDFSLKYSAAEVDVAGKPINNFLGYSQHEPVAATIAGDPLFSTGAKIYQVNFIAVNDAYAVDNWFDCAPQHADPNGNCNIVFGHASNTVFQPAQTFADLIYPTDPSGGNWFSVGEGIEIRIVQGGVVRITDTLAPESSRVSYGSWEPVTVHGQQIMMLTLPERFTPRFWDQGRQFLTVIDGYVRRGSFLSAGTPETVGEIQFNDVAFQDIQDNSSVL